jgi:hypothetical protein
MPAPTMMTLGPAAVARKAYCDRLGTASTGEIIAVEGIDLFGHLLFGFVCSIFLSQQIYCNNVHVVFLSRQIYRANMLKIYRTKIRCAHTSHTACVHACIVAYIHTYIHTYIHITN